MEKPMEVYDHICGNCEIFQVWKENDSEETEPIKRDIKSVGEDNDAGYYCYAQEYLREHQIINGRDCPCKEILEMNAV